MGLVSQQNQIETFLPEIAEFSLFKKCDRSMLSKLFENAQMRSSKHREVLYRIGESATKFSLILRGAYKLVRPTPRGEDVIVYFAAPGDAVAAFVMPQPDAVYPVTAISMGPSLVLDIPRDTYIKYWAKNVEIVLHMQNLLYNRMILLQDQKLFSKSPLEQKVAQLILQLIEKYSRESDGILPIPLTRKEIADSLGSTVESVIRIMSDWSHQGIIKTSDQYIEVLDTGRVIALIQEG
ncbi:MAG: hypothetical protein A2622_12805 [Bdellovibrionales bacterium RIFCSPHIGHO2_01_FULL_40_29]|nr:MAG: hypothetical protein A2622_12805 [Bdellovibrionales bacterium RIFCSPHIGHO2_01_FULL_40_29]OFZ33425.1 MAG: hypothetical protein A3D17_14080 [Bdellovibrionales bacterium RIFCSPHIGHO2_02_FULL_40_15]